MDSHSLVFGWCVKMHLQDPPSNPHGWLLTCMKFCGKVCPGVGKRKKYYWLFKQWNIFQTIMHLLSLECDTFHRTWRGRKWRGRRWRRPSLPVGSSLCGWGVKANTHTKRSSIVRYKIRNVEKTEKGVGLRNWRVGRWGGTWTKEGNINAPDAELSRLCRLFL